jgi:hypothetical protein
MAQVPAPFALTPAYQMQNQALNYQEKRDADTYYKGCLPLEGDPCDGTKLKDFLARLQAKASQFGWDQILTVQNRNLLDDYGVITREDVIQHARVYQVLNDRRAQNSDMLYHCARTSITSAIRERVNTNTSRFQIRFRPTPNDPEVIRFDGVCYLKAIIDETYTSTLSNASIAGDNLSTLDKYMKELPESNVTNFHLYVKENLQDLAAANETTNDLLVNLFKGYRAVKDKRFLTWIQGIEDQWADRVLRFDNNGLQLMEKAENYYKDRVKKKLWLHLDEDQENIIALKAQLTQRLGGRDRRKKKTLQRTTRKEDAAWKTQPPKPGEPRKKQATVNGTRNTYYWCQHHAKWKGDHKPQAEKKRTSNPEKNKEHGKENEPSLQVLATALQETDSDHEGELIHLLP